MDTLASMRTFVEVVDAGGFSAAARKLGRSKALVSKSVKELEDQLTTRLLNRTTRQLSLTELGQAYYRDATEILQRVDNLEDMVRERHGEPTGKLRVAAPRTFGDGVLGSAIMQFAAAHPAIELELSLDDRLIDLVDEGFDCAIRVSELADSSLIARKILSIRWCTVARPDVVALYGLPLTPDDLRGKPCIIDTNARNRYNWGFMVDGAKHAVPVTGRIQANSPIAVREAALHGLGFAFLPYEMVQKSLANGELTLMLEAFEYDRLSAYVVYPHRRHLSAKVRAFVDFMTSGQVIGICPAAESASTTTPEEVLA